MALLHYMLLHALIIIAPEVAQGAHEASTYLLCGARYKKQRRLKKKMYCVYLYIYCYYRVAKFILGWRIFASDSAYNM